MSPKSRSLNEHDRLPHPPVRARRYDTAVEGPLTNKKIVEYALAGYYGTAIQERAKALVAKRTKRKLPTTDTIAMKVQALLDDLL